MREELAISHINDLEDIMQNIINDLTHDKLTGEEAVNHIMYETLLYALHYKYVDENTVQINHGNIIHDAKAD